MDGGPMDGVGGTIKRVVYGLVKSRRINTNTAEEFADKASKGVPSIKSLFLSQEDENIEPSFVKNALAIKGTMDIHHIKRDYNLGNVCFLEFYHFSDDKEPFHTQYYARLNTLAWDHEGESDEVNKNICGHCQKVYDWHRETRLQCSACRIWFHESCFKRKVHLWFSLSLFRRKKFILQALFSLEFSIYSNVTKLLKVPT